MAWLAAEPADKAELDAMIDADPHARERLEARLADPVPLFLTQNIDTAPLGLPVLGAAKAPARPIWESIAVSLGPLRTWRAGH